MLTKIYKTENTMDAAIAVSGKKRKAVLWMGLQVLLSSAVLVTILLITFLDARQPVLTDRFSEQSFTEYAQEISLLLAILFFYGSARLFPKQAVVAYLVGGFLGMAFIREFDSWLDSNVADGAWQILAYSLAGLTAYLAYKQRAYLWLRLASFIQTRAFGVIITGMLIVFIYSRLYSDKQIWMSAMGEENYMYVVTRASEEAIELLGYALILLGSADYLFFLQREQVNKLLHKRQKEVQAAISHALDTPQERPSTLQNS
ncbi:MAG: hypothetical protein AVDCRST_MAG95-3002 [uncultured Adhaeribacter sp.]|uniref:Uncharacterized protein n=1 Tax=uncultured Adhaeribacter sp. TaxID=448109 RepID=A0A6J4JER8_9BACT|nr:MAG: hypothetical protein AVDCRST_MAG95-3002 [uncultured Adhaeribacter sp.]